MRNTTFKVLTVAMASMLALTACSKSDSKPAASSPAETNSPSATAGTTAAGKPTKIVFWTFQELHSKYYQGMAEKWNKLHPDKPIEFEGNVYPYDDLHNKLLVALQTGVGAPDMADIEITKFANYLKGTPQLAPLNDIIEPEINNLVKSRLDIYAKDGKYYGIDYHVGASVIYYNKEILDKAGVNPDNIKTWDDFKTAGKTVLEKTGIPMTTVEATEQWSMWPLIAQQDSDLLGKDGSVTLDNEKNIKTMTYLQNLVKEKIAVPAPGGFHHAEEYYAFMNKGGAASIWMPMWYMGRFTDYMPDLKGKIIIRPMPAWEPGGARSAGMGGTGTVVTQQSKVQDVTKQFLAYAKLSKEGAIEIWKQLGFDPIRSDVWNDPALKEKNKFTDYFGDNIFDTLNTVKDEIKPVNIGEKTPAVIDAVKRTAEFKIINDLEDPAKVLKEVADEVRNQ
ncbi:ABC transporter substrate-binding protein [Paenibacillus hexagrammi]|uniref:Extracellular solute-binding protein n=1 Tax=Paenibacillus hexagrammi TaxID=2908839 RepID=A0ABY3SH86_9BACL|nr:extracellular solute-binding protein [Paenibacillus sp. YPD9-1]UJF32571.1 extracellular solute-binding protein [Paenibacillus sp. YPD9-1]